MAQSLKFDPQSQKTRQTINTRETSVPTPASSTSIFLRFSLRYVLRSRSEAFPGRLGRPTNGREPALPIILVIRAIPVIPSTVLVTTTNSNRIIGSSNAMVAMASSTTAARTVVRIPFIVAAAIETMVTVAVLMMQGGGASAAVVVIGMPAKGSEQAINVGFAGPKLRNYPAICNDDPS